MKLLRIEIEEFGKLANVCYELEDGINLFEGANESGKSTLLAFIRFIFYGFPRKGGAEGEEREKRLSWQGHRAAGKLYLQTERGEFCIQRSVVRQGSAARESFSEQLSMISLAEGREVALDGKTPGEYLMGLSPTLYDSTLCLRQSDAARVSSADVGEAVGEMLFSGSSGVGADAALEQLRAARRELLHQKGRGGRIADLEDAIAQGQVALVRAIEDTQKLQELKQNALRCREQVKERRVQLEQISAAFEQASIAQSLALFEDVHAAERVLEQQKLTAQALAARNNERGLPDAARVAAAQDALRAREIAIEAGARMTPELERMRSIRYNQDMVEAHATVTERGGAEAVLADFGKAQRRCRRTRNAALVFLAFFLLLGGALACILSGLATPLLRLLPTGTYLPDVCLCLLIGAGVSLAFMLIFSVLSLRARRTLRVWQKLLRVAHLPMFRTYLEQCAAEAKAQQTHQAVLSTLEGEYNATAAQVLSAENEVRAVLSEAGVGADVEIEESPAYLVGIIKAREADEQELAEARLEVERAAAAVEALRRPLEGQNEASLRARYRSTPTESADELRRRQAFLHESIAGLEGKCAEAERREHALAATLQNADELRARQQMLQRELEEAKGQLDTVQMACEALTEASEALQKGITPRLCEEASGILAELTGGAYTALHPDKDFAIMLEGECGLLPLSHFSAGCRDAACLALRLALLSTLCDEQLPLLFDEAMSRLDDQRAKALLELLERHAYRGGQCLLFTCHSREAKLLSPDSYKRFTL